MSYHILETPDHLHKGLHLFAVAHLRVLLDWLEEMNSGEPMSEHLLGVSEHWFLRDIAEAINRKEPKPRLLLRKDAQDFIKQHPEFKIGSTGQGWAYLSPPEPPSRKEEELNRELIEDYEEYEIRTEISEWPAILDCIEVVRVGIETENIDEISLGIDRLYNLLYEISEPPPHVLDALLSIYDLINYGLKENTYLLDRADDKEAYEITSVCQGQFRAWAKQDINKLRLMPPRDFENLVAEMLAQHGLRNIQTTPIVADDGVDIIAAHVSDGQKLKYIIQCKRFAEKKVSVSVVRELVGSKMYTGANYALLVTTSDFTKPARKYALQSKAQIWGIRLIDYKLLMKLLDLTD